MSDQAQHKARLLWDIHPTIKNLVAYEVAKDKHMALVMDSKY